MIQKPLREKENAGRIVLTQEIPNIAHIKFLDPKINTGSD